MTGLGAFELHGKVRLASWATDGEPTIYVTLTRQEAEKLAAVLLQAASRCPATMIEANYSAMTDKMPED